MSEMEATVNYSEEEYLYGSELEDKASFSSLGATDVSTAAASEALNT